MEGLRKLAGLGREIVYNDTAFAKPHEREIGHVDSVAVQDDQHAIAAGTEMGAATHQALSPVEEHVGVHTGQLFGNDKEATLR